MNLATLHHKAVAPLWALEARHLRDQDALDEALSLCIGAVNISNFEAFVEDLLTKPNLLQLFISGKSDRYMAHLPPLNSIS